MVKGGEGEAGGTFFAGFRIRAGSHSVMVMTMPYRMRFANASINAMLPGLVDCSC